MRIYKILKKTHDNTNSFSRAMQAFVDKYIVKQKGGQ